jgi:hypothetical protein
MTQRADDFEALPWRLRHTVYRLRLKGNPGFLMSGWSSEIIMMFAGFCRNSA